MNSSYNDVFLFLICINVILNTKSNGINLLLTLCDNDKYIVEYAPFCVFVSEIYMSLKFKNISFELIKNGISI